ncbi:MAG: hypothetical protein ABIJ00_04790 [Candidatus Eisenbacteria bacterium]
MRFRTVCCCAVCVVLLMGGIARSTGAGDSGDTTCTPASDMTAAAMRGIEWLIANQDAISPAVAVTTFRKIYRVTADDSLAARLLEIIEETEPTLPQVNIAVDIHDRDSRRWHKLRPVLIELVRNKCVNQVFETDLRPIEDLRDFYWDRLFLSTMDLSKKVVAAYLLKRLGVADELYDSVVEEVRSQADLLNQPRSYHYVFYLYALTHVVLTNSGYYDHYLDPAGFAVEIAGFDKALRDFLALEDMTSTELDVASEALTCLKLLRVPADPRMERMYQRLMEEQNPDGSWGSDKEVTGSRIHNTVVASIALLDFAPEFRDGDIYCDSITYGPDPLPDSE